MQSPRQWSRSNWHCRSIAALFAHSFNVTTGKRYGLARVLSKLGICSRAQAEAMIREGRVSVGGRIQSDPERPTDAAAERIAIDGTEVVEAQRRYLAFNKPRGVIVSAVDDQNRHGSPSPAQIPRRVRPLRRRSR